MNYNLVGRKIPGQTTSWVSMAPLKKFAPLAFNFFTHYSGIGALSKVPEKLTASHLEVEVDGHNGKEVRKVPLNTTQRVGLATGELLVGSARLLPWASLAAAPVCDWTEGNNRVCRAASTISKWEWWGYDQAKDLLSEAKEHVEPLAKSGCKLVIKGMSELETHLVTHLALWGAGLYCLKSGYNDYKLSPLSAHHFGKITISRKSNSLGANAWRITKFLGKSAIGLSLIGTSLAFRGGLIAPIVVPPNNDTGGSPGPSPA